MAEDQGFQSHLAGPVFVPIFETRINLHAPFTAKKRDENRNLSEA